MTEQVEHVIPSRFLLVRVFHAVAAYSLRAGPQWVHRPEYSTASLSRQIEKWVQTTGSLIASVSAPGLTVSTGMKDGLPLQEHRMSVSVLYSAAAEDIYDPERRNSPAPEAWFPPIAEPGVAGDS